MFLSSRYKNSPSILELSLGDWDLNATNDAPNKDVKVSTITVHPKYSRATLQNDLAILKLTQKITFAENIKPICLPDKGEFVHFSFRDCMPCL